jgi:hypothetical protein
MIDSGMKIDHRFFRNIFRIAIVIAIAMEKSDSGLQSHFEKG